MVGLAVNGAVEIIDCLYSFVHCPRILVSTLRGSFYYVTLRFGGL